MPRTFSSVHALILASLVVGGLAFVVGAELGELLVHRGVHEEREDRRRRPLMVIETDVFGAQRSVAVVEHLHVLDGGDRHAGLPTLP